MRIVIFGGTGFIGTAMLATSWIRNYQVVVVSRKPPAKATENLITYISYDSEHLQRFFSGSYAVINLAGAGIGNKPWTRGRKRLILDSRIHVTQRINELIIAAEDKPQLVLQASAVGYYGSRGDELLTENSSRGEGFLADVSDAWENILESNTAEIPRRVILRTGLVLNRNAGLLSKLEIAFKCFLGGYFGDGNQWMPWIHLEDELGAIRFFLENPSTSGIYNIVAPNPARMKHFFKQLAKELHRPSWLHIPSAVVRLIPGGFGEELLLISQNAKPEKLLQEGFTFVHPHLEGALQNLYRDE